MQGYNNDNYPDYSERQLRPPMQYNYRNGQRPFQGGHRIAPLPTSPPPLKASEVSSSNSSLDMKEVINRIKFVWDIFSAMHSAWNSVGQQQTKPIKEKKKLNMTASSLQTVDSNLPTNYQNAVMKNSKEKSTMASIKLTSKTETVAPTYTTTTTTTTKATDSTPSFAVDENDSDRDDDEHYNMRRRRNSENAVGEARYIKGDPLKGYYDFVITEGSYKFWAAFQVK